MKKLIIGSGKVSKILFAFDKDNTDVVTHDECDIIKIDDVRKAIMKYKPEVVINCAARTSLEYCEDNKADAVCTNTLGPINILDVCHEENIKFVHISSGCLFDGNQEISTEESIPTPAVWYTWTKKWADDAIMAHVHKNVLILRPRQLVSKKSHPSNLLTKFLGLDKISAIDEPNSITCIEDFAEMLDHLLHKDAVGIFNCANQGTISPLKISLMIKNEIKPELDVKHVSYDELLKKLPNRRVNTILSIDKLLDTGYLPRSATDAVKWCLKNYE